ncbi:MAG TPA: universal stress protein [Acidimicrobiia bacterium]|nr:universal stress protein [Acidimicrobiia bacterium]
MPHDAVYLIVVAVWISFGPALALVMGRRGHNPSAWGVFGALLGPIAVPVAFDATRRNRTMAVKTVSAGGPAGDGIAVLAGIDGSEEARQALTRAAALFGKRIGRLVLVSVLPYDSADDPAVLKSDESEAGLWLAPAAAAVAELNPEEYIVVGRPAAALAELAESDRFDVIVVGARGKGLSHHLFGSVAAALVESSPVPVLVGGRPAECAVPHLRPR